MILIIDELKGKNGDLDFKFYFASRRIRGMVDFRFVCI